MNRTEGEVPRVSIVIPYYNVPHAWFKECMDSIEAQTFKDFETVVVDNLSDNPVPYFADVARVTNWVRQRTNLVEAYNLGVQLARGEYVALFSANDTYHPDFLATTVPLLDAHPEAEFVATHNSLWTDEIFERCTMWAMGLFRRSLLSWFGPFERNPWGVDGNNDWDFWMRARRAKVKGITIPDVLSTWRQHDDSVSHAIVGSGVYWEQVKWMKERK